MPPVNQRLAAHVVGLDKNDRMRFSLKDLFWSVTFACLAIASVTIAFRMRYWPSHDIVIIPRLIFTLAPGPLLGAAFGTLFRRTDLGILVGFALQTVLFVLFGMWAATLD